MELARSKRGIFVSQKKHILDLLKEIRMKGCILDDTPINIFVKLGKVKDGTPVDTKRYQIQVGKLTYLSHTRPNIDFVVIMVNHFMNCP